MARASSWVRCGMAACCSAVVVYTGCLLSEHNVSGTGSIPRRAGQLGPAVTGPGRHVGESVSATKGPFVKQGPTGS